MRALALPRARVRAGCERDADYGIGGTVVVFGKPLADRLNLELSAFGNTLRRGSDNGNDSQFGLAAGIWTTDMARSIRLSFVTASEDQIRTGVAALAQAIRQYPKD